MRLRTFSAGALCALALSLFLSGCNRETKRTIAVIPKGRAHMFWQSVHAGAMSVAQPAGVDIIWNGPASETDFTGQIQIVDAMINREIQLVVNTPIGKDSTIDDAYIRRAAVRYQVPCITTLTGALAAADGIAALRERSLGVRSLQELFRPKPAAVTA